MAWLVRNFRKTSRTGPRLSLPAPTRTSSEEALFARRRDLFSDLDIVFFDTTSIYFEGEGGETIGQRGHSKDHRPDLNQMVVAWVLDTTAIRSAANSGLATRRREEPGSHRGTPEDPVRNRIGLHRCRPRMISAETLADVELRKWQYILGVRMRSSTEPRRWWLAPAAMRKCIPKATTGTILRR